MLILELAEWEINLYQRPLTLMKPKLSVTTVTEATKPICMCI